MVFPQFKPHRYKLLIFLSLAFASVASIAMMVIRFVYTESLTYAFLVWNLLLAWVPLFFAYLSHHFYEKLSRINPMSLYCAFIWLIFLPNAPYLITDLFYLGTTDQVPLWFDLILLISFAWTGLLLGMISLYLMQEVVTEAYGRVAGWLFSLGTLGASSFGIYLGRFLRWNSWDVFLNPTGVASDILDRVLHPLAHRGTFAVSLLFTVVFTFTYMILFSLTRLPLERAAGT
jgi:uncharacterized membrane protein